MTFRTFLVTAGTGMCLLGCTVGPNYRPPDPPAVPQWKDQAAQGVLALLLVPLGLFMSGGKAKT